MRSDQIKKWMRENPELMLRQEEKALKQYEQLRFKKREYKAKKNGKKRIPKSMKLGRIRGKKLSPHLNLRAKRNASIAEWKKNNPIQAEENLRKSVRAANAKRSKAVNMIELKTGKILKRFKSQHDAARCWSNKVSQK
jgi:hypothetical protein